MGVLDALFDRARNGDARAAVTTTTQGTEEDGDADPETTTIRPHRSLRSRFDDSGDHRPATPATTPPAMRSTSSLDQRPAAIATPGSAAETAALVTAVRDAGLRIAAQGSRHNAGAARRRLATRVFMRLERMTASSSTRPTRTARVEAGARWWDLIDQASEAGLAARHGSSPEINIIGYSLGGGVGWLARKHGLQANAITAIEIITADGEHRRRRRRQRPDLFWALRGGGGNFGVVTAIEFELVPLTAVHAGALFFAFERAAEVLGAYREWTARFPDEITSVGRTLQLPDLPEVPEIVRGKSFSIIEAIHSGSAAEARELLAPLRELGRADGHVRRRRAGRAPVPAHGPGRPGSVRRRPRDARRVHRARARRGDGAAVGPGTGSPVSFEVRHLGGELSRSDESHGALDTMQRRVHDVRPRADHRPGDGPDAEDGLAALDAAFAPDDSGAT